MRRDEMFNLISFRLVSFWLMRRSEREVKRFHLVNEISVTMVFNFERF